MSCHGLAAEQDDLDQHDGQEDRERIVGAGFDLERGGDARPQPQAPACSRKNTAAASVEATTAPTSSASVQPSPSA